MNESCHTYEWDMSHIWMRHVTHMNESCHTYEWGRHATRTNASQHTCEWVTAHTWMSLVTHMNESCHTYEWVMSHIWMSHVTHMNESCHTYERVMSHVCMSHVTHINVTHINDGGHAHMQTDSSFLRVKSRIRSSCVCVRAWLCIHIHIYIYIYMYKYHAQKCIYSIHIYTYSHVLYYSSSGDLLSTSKKNCRWHGAVFYGRRLEFLHAPALVMYSQKKEKPVRDMVKFSMGDA